MAKTETTGTTDTPKAPAPPQVIVQNVNRSEGDFLLDALREASKQVDVSTIPQDLDGQYLLPDACLRRKGGERQRTHSGWVDVPITLSDGTPVNYIVDDNEALAFTMVPVTNIRKAGRNCFPVTPDKFPDLKPWETDSRGYIYIDDCILFFMTRAERNRRRKQGEAGFENLVGTVADTGTKSSDIPELPQSKHRARIMVADAMDAEEYKVAKNEMPPSLV